MKIEVNIEKKHLLIFAGFLVVLLGGLALAVVPNPGHSVSEVDFTNPIGQKVKIDYAGTYALDVAGQARFNTINGVGTILSGGDVIVQDNVLANSNNWDSADTGYTRTINSLTGSSCPDGMYIIGLAWVGSELRFRCSKL